MEQTLTFSIQDYLKSIYELTAEGNAANTNALAARMGVTAASVTGMVQKLASLKPALVSYRKHQGVKLTPAGKRAALEVIRRHRLMEVWLVEALGYRWDEVHGEAEKLEHAVSDDLEKRISAALGNPDHDPHGEPIPSADLVMPRDGSAALADLATGRAAIVRRVRADDPAMLKHLADVGIRIGTRLEAVEISPYDQVMSVRIDGKKDCVSVGPAITRSVYVEIVKKSGRPGREIQR
jgi:DtxR family Mn-dependent transcriptional regulator